MSEEGRTEFREGPQAEEAAQQLDPRLRHAGVLAIAFGAGFGVMTIEVAGARVIAPVFGLSAVPWTAVIGVILTALAVGNYVGGRLADAGRLPLGAVLAAGGVAALFPAAGAAVPQWAADRLGFVLGAVVSAAILFAPAILALGTTIPYLVRAQTLSLDTVGRRTGDIGAAATVGSIAGTFVTGFVLLPVLPLPTLLAATAGGLLLLGGLAVRLLGGPPRPGVLAVAAILAGALGLGRGAPVAGVLHTQETVYGSIQVVESRWADGRRVRELKQNGGSSSAEEVETGAPAHRYAQISLELIDSLSPDSLLFLGGGALTLPVAVSRLLPESRVDVVELDPVATELARRYFSFGAAGPPGVYVHHGDARVYLGRSRARYDVVYLDVFEDLVTVPWTLVTVEALRSIRERLTPDGVFLANVLTPLEGSGAEFLRRLLGTVEIVFRSVRAYPVFPQLDGAAIQNVVIVASASSETLPPTRHLRVVLPPSGPALVDDHAPVEYLQARLFMEGLKWR